LIDGTAPVAHLARASACKRLKTHGLESRWKEEKKAWMEKNEKGTLDPLRVDLQFNYVCRGGAFLALHNLKTHFLSLGQRLEA